MSTTVHLLVRVRNEKPLYEEVHVEDRGGGTYRLLQSPGLVLDLAADDVFLLEAGGTFKLLRRGGNISIQMFSRQPLDSFEPRITSELAQRKSMQYFEAGSIIVELGADPLGRRKVDRFRGVDFGAAVRIERDWVASSA